MMSNELHEGFSFLGNMNHGVGFLGGFEMIIFWIIFILLIYWLIKKDKFSFNNNSNQYANNNLNLKNNLNKNLNNNSLFEIAKKRLALGEITKKEFEFMKKEFVNKR